MPEMKSGDPIPIESPLIFLGLKPIFLSKILPHNTYIPSDRTFLIIVLYEIIVGALR